MKKVSVNTDVSKLLRKWIREVAGAKCTNYPIVVVKGENPPALKGKSWHYVNKSGDVIRHVNAYKQAWGKPIYVRSTRRIEVGSDWLLTGLSHKKIKLQKLAVFK
jgi:hypothetical protein